MNRDEMLEDMVIADVVVQVCDKPVRFIVEKRYKQEYDKEQRKTTYEPNGKFHINIALAGFLIGSEFDGISIGIAGHSIDVWPDAFTVEYPDGRKAYTEITLPSKPKEDAR